MSDKLLQEFMTKLHRTRGNVNDSKKQCDYLKKEAKRLEQELASLEHNKSELLKIEETLKVHYVSTKMQNEEVFEKNSFEHEELNKLKRAKRNKLKEKESLQKDIDKLSNELQSLTKQREQLESVAKSLSLKLDQVSLDRVNTQNETKKQQEHLHALTRELSMLREEKETLNRAVALTFEEELKYKK